MNPDESNKRNFRIAPFVLAMLCFALPFIEVSCKNENGKKEETMTFSGFSLAFGGKIKQTNPMTGQVEEKPVKQQAQFLIAFLCAVAGVGGTFMAGKNGKLVSAIAGALGLLFLIIGKGSLLGDEVPAQMRDVILVSAKPGFVLACICFAAGAVISGLQWREEDIVRPAPLPPPPPDGSYSANLPPVPGLPPPPPPPPN